MGGGMPSKQRDNFWNGDIPWIAPKEMKTFRIMTSSLQISEAAISESSAKLIPAHSVLFFEKGRVATYFSCGLRNQTPPTHRGATLPNFVTCAGATIYVSPLPGLKIIIRLTQGFAALTLGFYVVCPPGRQYDVRQPDSVLQALINKTSHNNKNFRVFRVFSGSK
jgi:hypothetical protein